MNELAISNFKSKYLLAGFLFGFLLFPWKAFSQDSKSADNDFAVYHNPETNVFLTDWFVIGPIPFSTNEEAPETEEQKKIFQAKDFVQVQFNETGPQDVSISEKIYAWQKLRSKTDIIDFQVELGEANWVFSYALATIYSDEDRTVLYGIGSDDAVKIYLNGVEVHSNFIGRAVQKDNDLLELKLRKGQNQVLIKIVNMQYGWGFSFRPLGGKVLAELLNSCAASGDFDNLEILLKYKPDFEWKSPEGLTAWQQAQVNGRKDIDQFLIENGAVENNNFPKIDSYIDSYIVNTIGEESPGFAVLVAKDGEILFEQAYGFANIEEAIPASPTTKFRIGSITKQFIAAAILKLQEQGKISVNDKLEVFIPDFPRGDEVTIHHLLTHTSGIHSFTNQPGFIDYVTQKAEAKTIVDSIKSWEFDFNPGEKWEYNNSGYFLLGIILEKVSGKGFGDYLYEEFFKPFGMNNTGIYVNEEPPENTAIGYTVEEGAYKPALDWNMSWAGGAGSMYSTVVDLYKWNEAVFNGKVLSEESITAAHTPVKLNNGELPPSGKYGYGWAIVDFRGVTEIAHGGGLHGFISYLSRFKEENLTIVTLTNCTPTMDGLNPNGTSDIFAQYAIWDKLAPRESNKTVEIEKSKLDDYLGRYDYGNSMVLTITRSDDKLLAQMSGQNQFEIYPSGEDEFYWKVVEAKIKFKRDGTGKVVSGIHFQGGNELKVIKLPEIKTLELDTELLKPYLGKYKVNNDFMVEVTLSGNSLFVQGTGQPKLELFRIEDNKYMPKEVLIGVSFYEENGKYMLEMDQGGVKNRIGKVE